MKDGRSLSHAALEAIRIRAVLQVEAGESPEAVIRALGFSRARIYEWLTLYRTGGLDALRARPVPGAQPKLGNEALAALYATATCEYPEQYGYPPTLWTRTMLREQILQQSGCALSEASLARSLRKLGLTPQRPMMRLLQQQPGLAQDWIRTALPGIRAQASAANAELLFATETTIHAGSLGLPAATTQRLTPALRISGTQRQLQLLTALSPRGQMRFMCSPLNITAQLFVSFLQRLTEGANRPIFLIVDRHPAHRASAVREFAAGIRSGLHLYYLPNRTPSAAPTWSWDAPADISRQPHIKP